MKTTNSIALLAALLLGTSAMAADSQETEANKTAVKASDVKAEKKNTIDDEITNARMRANSGSKSKYSFSTTVGYQGGSVVNGLGELRPNLAGDPNDLANSVGYASVSGRYRLNKNISFTLGTGVSVARPTKGLSTTHVVETKKGPKEVDRYYVSDPSISAAYAGKIGRFQMISSVSGSYGTSPRSIEANEVAGFGLSQTMLTTLGESGVTAGLAVALGWTAFDDFSDGDSWDYTVGIYPFAEYGITDKYSLRTVFGYFNYYHQIGDKQATLWNMHTSNPYQSVGIGISVTRDIYVYPNIQFIPEEKNMAWDKTNVAISATINIL